MNLIFLPNQEHPVPGVVSHGQKVRLVLVLCKYHIDSWHFQQPKLNLAKAKELESFGRGTVMVEVHMDRKRGNRHGLQ